MDTLFRSDVPGYPRREGKVRDVYDLGDRLAIIASDRISAFDWVMPTPIPGKGRILTALSKFWFQWLNVPNHWITDDVTTLPEAFHPFAGRTMIVRKTAVVPFECVARGYLEDRVGRSTYAAALSAGFRCPPGCGSASACRNRSSPPRPKPRAGTTRT